MEFLNISAGGNKDIDPVYKKKKDDFLDKKQYDYSSYKIKKVDDDLCYQTYPCQHRVKVKIDNDTIYVLLCGRTIANYYKYNKLDVPSHFKNYIQ